MNVSDLYLKILDILSTDFKLNNTSALIEDHKDATCREIKLSKSGSLSIYKFDLRPSQAAELLPFFKNTADGHKQLCDYLIFYPFKEKLIVYICNLKSKNQNNTDRQVKNGYIFSKYLVEMASLCLNVHNPPNFVEFKAIHFISQKGAMKITTNPRDMKFKMYPNQLKYMTLSCQNTFYLDWLGQIN